MLFADRLGVVALIMFFVGLAVTYLLPDKKLIGWASLSIALVLTLCWIWIETKDRLGVFVRDYRGSASVTIFFCGGCIFLTLFWLIAPRFLAQSKTIVNIPGITDVPAPEILAQRPWLQGSLMWIGVAKFDRKNPKTHTIALLVKITNLGTPTTVRDYTLFIKVPGRPLPIRILNPDTPPEKLMTPHGTLGGKSFEIVKEDSLVEKTVEHPIPNGGSVKGFLIFHTDALSEQDFENAGLQYTVFFSDIRFLQFSASGSFPPSYQLPEGFAGLKSTLH